MDQSDLSRLTAEYVRMSDEQIRDLMKSSPEDFLPQAYRALCQEASRRGIGHDCAGACDKAEDDQRACSDLPGEEAIFVQVAVINSPADLGFLESLLARADIAYSLENMNIRGYSAKELPVALLVEEARVADTIELLKDFKPHNTFLLW